MEKTKTGVITFIAKTRGIQLDNDRSIYYNPLPNIKDKVVDGLIGKEVTLTMVENSKNNAFSELTPQEPTRQNPSTASPTELHIIRQTCIKAAVEFCAARPFTKNEIISMAEEFERWILR